MFSGASVCGKLATSVEVGVRRSQRPVFTGNTKMQSVMFGDVSSPCCEMIVLPVFLVYSEPLPSPSLPLLSKLLLTLALCDGSLSGTCH